MAVITRPVTGERWADMVTFFEAEPTCRYCWCMWWREKRAHYFQMGGQKQQQAMREIVERGDVPGLLAYESDAPVGWVSVAPGDAFPCILRSRLLRPPDDLPVWSIVCLTVGRHRRHRGLSRLLVDGAVHYAAACGAGAIEAYPVREIRGDLDGQAITGALSTYIAAGFDIVADRGGRRVIVRRTLEATAR